MLKLNSFFVILGVVILIFCYFNIYKKIHTSESVEISKSQDSKQDEGYKHIVSESVYKSKDEKIVNVVFFINAKEETMLSINSDLYKIPVTNLTQKSPSNKIEFENYKESLIVKAEGSSLILYKNNKMIFTGERYEASTTSE